LNKINKYNYNNIIIFILSIIPKFFYVLILSNMSNNLLENESELKFVNYDEFISLIKILKILCTNTNVSAYTFNKIFNIAEYPNNNNNINKLKIINDIPDNNVDVPSDSILREILSEVCPPKLSNIIKLFSFPSKSTSSKKKEYNEMSEYLDFVDLIFTCTSAKIVSKTSILDNVNEYYGIDEWLNNNSLPYLYFNSNKVQTSRVVTNENKKNVLTLKIKNEDLKEDLLAINILLKLTGNSEQKQDYLLNVKAYVVNDSYDTIRNDEIFLKYFNHNRDSRLYNKINLRDCCLNSFNGQHPTTYIENVYRLISNCNSLCLSNNDGDLQNMMTDINSESNECSESAHFIQKFAKYCFHTKYLIIVHTAESHIQVCLFLAVILVRCNNRLCREFLDTLPNLIKQMIMSSAGIGGTDESKTDITVMDKVPLSQKVTIWKQLFSAKYGVNVKKLVDKCTELCADEDNKGGGMFGEGNAEKERIKKMINYLEKISSNFFLLNIHKQLIDLVDAARLMYVKSNINSLQDVLIAMVNDTSKHKNSNLLSGNLSEKIKEYLENFAKFELTVRERILNMSEGQLTIKKAVWQYIMDIVCNANPLATRKILCLIGPPGVGKTFIAMCIARILFFEPDKNPSEDEVKNLVYVLSIPSLTGENTLLGSNAVYVGAQPGILTKEVLFVGSLFRKLIVIDEIDKPCKYVEQLLSVLDYTQNSKIVDNYFEIEVDMRTCVLIATANDETKINPIIRDRMQIIKVSGYSTYVKAAMVQKQMLRSLLKERGLQEDLIRIPLPVLEDLIMTRTREAGVRKLKNLILEIINTVNIAIITNISTLSSAYNKYTHDTYIDDDLAMQHIDNDYYRYNNYNIEELYSNITKRYISYLNSVNKCKINNIILTKDDISIMLSDKYKLNIDHIRDMSKWEPGKVIGLYATTMGVGGILPIALKFNRTLAKKGMLITLGAQKTMQDSAMISNMLTSDYLSKFDSSVFTKYFGITQNEFNKRTVEIANNSALHIILDSSIQKDGPSAGGAFMVSHLSKILGHTLCNRVGITGEISSNFKITAIGGINMKVNGAMLAGCKSVVAPSQNTADILREIISENSIDVKNELKKRCAFIYWSEQDKCYVLLVRTKPTNNTNKNISSFDINIEEGNENYLLDFEIDVPSIYKIKLSNFTEQNNLINPLYGLDVKLINNITLRYIMETHFLILAMENIYEIYYYMVMAKRVYNVDSDLEEDSFYKNVRFDNYNVIESSLPIEFDGCKLNDSSIDKLGAISKNSEDKMCDECDDEGEDDEDDE